MPDRVKHDPNVFLRLVLGERGAGLTGPGHSGLRLVGHPGPPQEPLIEVCQ